MSDQPTPTANTDRVSIPDETEKAEENLKRYFELAFEVASQEGAPSNSTVDNSVPGHTMTERSNINAQH